MEELRLNIPENTTWPQWPNLRLCSVYWYEVVSTGYPRSKTFLPTIYNDSNDMMPSSNILSHQIDTRVFQ